MIKMKYDSFGRLKQKTRIDVNEDKIQIDPDIYNAISFHYGSRGIFFYYSGNKLYN